MKILFRTALLLTILLAAACNHNGPSSPKKTVITGHIKNLQVFPDDKKMVLEVTDFGGGPTKYIGPIDKNGSFKISFDQYITEDVKLTQDFRTSPIVNALIVHPGDNIHVELDYKAIGDVKFSGDAAETNTDLFLYTTGYYINADGPKSHYPLDDPQGFKAVCENMKTELLKNRVEFIDKEQPNDEVKTWTLNYIKLRYYTNLEAFLHAHNSAVGQLPGLTPSKDHAIGQLPGLTPLKDYINYGDDLDAIYNTNMLNSGSYQLLRFLIPPNDKKEIGKPMDERVRYKVFQINQENKNALLKQLLTGFLFQTIASLHYPTEFAKNRSVLESNVQAAFIKQPLLKYYASVGKEMKDPVITTNVTLHNNIPASQPKTIMDTILLQNKGKVIYVDLWATWCGPCRQEMPYSEKLKEKYKGKNITFAAVCINSPKSDWKASISALNLTGNQYYCDKTETESIHVGLKVSALPRYIMITKNGGIIANGNGLRPEDPLTARTIDKLLD